MGTDDVADAWQAHHRYVLDVAYRMLGSVSEAEDMVQEAFARLVDRAGDGIEDVRGWLVVVVTRLCLDQLRSSRAKRESSVGAWLPEPVIESDLVDPADRITLDDSVRMAMLVVLERLTPAERAAFVLHDVFGFSFEDVARIVGRSIESCRQLASRARKRIHDQAEPSRYSVDPAELERIADRFIAAAAEGDLAALKDVLDLVAGPVDETRERLLDHVLGLAHAAEQPVRHVEHVPMVRLPGVGDVVGSHRGSFLEAYR